MHPGQVFAQHGDVQRREVARGRAQNTQNQIGQTAGPDSAPALDVLNIPFREAPRGYFVLITPFRTKRFQYTRRQVKPSASGPVSPTPVRINQPLPRDCSTPLKLRAIDINIWQMGEVDRRNNN